MKIKPCRIGLAIGLLCLSLLGVQAQEQPVPTPQTQTPASQLTIWLPDELAPLDRQDIWTLLMEQTAAFELAEGVEVNIRLKRVSDLGGLMATLRTASSVAPGALPDLTLLRRQDLVAAQRSGLIQSLEGRLPTALLSSLDDTLILGQAGGDLYGLPYFVDLQHLVYRPTEQTAEPGWSFDEVVAREQPIIFPAGRATGLNDVFYLQYLAAGAQLSASGTLTLDADALESGLDFYQSASDSGLIDGFVLNYFTPEDYRSTFVSGEIDVALFSSTAYMQMLANEPDLRVAPIPTGEGASPQALLNGWSWVLVTPAAEQQDLSERFLNWMMNADRQADYARALYRLPSQRAAIQRGLASGADDARYIELLSSAALPLTESDGGTLARAIQSALASVLTKELSADDAAQLVRDQHGG